MFRKKDAASDHHGHSPWVKEELLARALCWSEVTKNTRFQKSRVLWESDTTAFMNGRIKELVEIAEKVSKTLTREVEEKGLTLSITEGGRKSKAATSCKHLEERFQECSRKEEAVLVTIVETLGVDLSTGTKRLVA